MNGKPALLEALHGALSSTTQVISHIWNEVTEATKLTRSTSVFRAGPWVRTKYVFSESGLAPMKEALRDQIQAIHLLLTVAATLTRADQDKLLQDAESIRTLVRARGDDSSSSRLWLRDADSRVSIDSHQSDNMSRLSLVFQFDEVVMGSKPYRAAVAATWKNLRTRRQGPVVVGASTPQPPILSISHEALPTSPPPPQTIEQKIAVPTQETMFIHECFRRINRRPEHDVHLAKQTLAWLLFSPSTSLPARTLRQALTKQRGLDPSSNGNLVDLQLIISVCGGLVELGVDSQVVHLAHVIFFTHDLQQWLDDGISYPSANAQINHTCFQQALDSTFFSHMGEWTPAEISAGERSGAEGEDIKWVIESEWRLPNEQGPFLAYSLRHISRSQSPSTSGFDVDSCSLEKSWPYLEKVSSILLNTSKNWPENRWVEMMKDAEAPIQAAVLFGEEEVLEKLLGLRQPSSGSQFVLADCLCWAAYQGNEPIVKLLLSAGARPSTGRYLTQAKSQAIPGVPAYSTCLSLATGGTRSLILSAMAASD
ncbi:hypothetical protein QBC34DRAFT_474685 [Podospora aff. communis PSN243]|uniref:Ankyrin repeat protein n=1 Tax=Podospora aff. communis PSN243 TaxID=3040156 RepID=A0AAV9G930_9PEZI|nr:hypothetical protein QBC34DRAFT_474685 [Podospora aff. communis PSN243]